ncbi:MAG: hypothetical protein JXA18_07070 [Chitinispirillaceae bacterium]|nr:hypothetical protein [Chitinispirillaceae bacterium]
MDKRWFAAAVAMLAASICSIICCDEGPIASEETSIVGIWAGGAGRQGGGGEGNLDSFGVVLTITGGGTFSLLRGNKIWGSSLFTRDSSRDAGTWDSTGNVITFTPDTTHDSCFQFGSCQDPPDGWCQCTGFNSPPNFCDCFPEFTLTKNIDGNVWRGAVIENAKLAGKYDTIDLVKQ